MEPTQLISNYTQYGVVHPLAYFIVTRIKTTPYYTVGKFFSEIDSVSLSTLYGWLANIDRDIAGCNPLLSSENIRNFYLVASLLAHGEGETVLDKDSLSKAVASLCTLVLLEIGIRNTVKPEMHNMVRKNYSLFDTTRLAPKKSSV